MKKIGDMNIVFMMLATFIVLTGCSKITTPSFVVESYFSFLDTEEKDAINNLINGRSSELLIEFKLKQNCSDSLKMTQETKKILNEVSF